jgi:uncharacterized SAM-binding protein YcdF (DUF218 family)/glycosyltransferase involved in cell wall biosynthesis
MIRELHNVVCISTIDWDFVWQGHQEIMSTLASQGHRVLFIENTGVRSATLKDLPRLKHRLRNWKQGVNGIRKVMDNIYVYAPLVLPFPYSRVARVVNRNLMRWTIRRWTRAMQFDNPIIWTWLPTPLGLDLIKILNGQLVVYYCCGDLQASSPGSRRIRETEEILLRQADLVFAHSKSVFDRCSHFTDQVHVFQYGFNRRIFAQVDDKVPADMASIPPPILGYVGGVHKVVDLRLIEKVARSHPDKSLVIVGPLQVDVSELAGLPNIHFLGQKRHEELPAYIKHFAIGLIPYVLNEYTDSVYPTKLNEYLIMGKPVVSTKLPEVEYFNRANQGIVAIANGHEAFVDLITDELKKDNESARAARILLVEKNAWDKKTDAMGSLIQEKLDEKSKSRDLDWQERLISLYRNSRRKALGVAAIAICSYYLIFYTPALWFLAEPLRIEETPVKADVIVVLAGGIGESGEPGEAYQEKVKHSVDLYRGHYAGHVIFSSGVGYVFKEAEVMKALAMSFGVPDSAIILDERGGGNYASLINAKRVMEARGWTRMLLVTSRYNALRSRLVVKKNLSGMAVKITPSPKSAFFGEEESVAWRHVRAITHEYAGILYYWLKGYI